MAVLGENTAKETRAEWFYELSIVCMAKGDHCEAIDFAREANAYRNDFSFSQLKGKKVLVVNTDSMQDPMPCIAFL